MKTSKLMHSRKCLHKHKENEGMLKHINKTENLIKNINNHQDELLSTVDFSAEIIFLYYYKKNILYYKNPEKKIRKKNDFKAVKQLNFK